jgi:outer membrane protein TolC
MKKLRILFFSFLLIPAIASAQPLTLGEAIRQAISRNPGIQALRETTGSEQSNVGVQKSRRYGELMLNGGLLHNSDEVLVRPMTKDLLQQGFLGLPFDDTSAFWSLEYRLPLYTGGALKENALAARSGMEAKKSELASTVAVITYQVAEAYIGLLSVQDQALAWKTYRQALVSLEDNIRFGLENGKYAQVDLLKVRYEIKNVDLKLETLKSQQITGTATLMALMGVSQETVAQYELQQVPFEERAVKLPGIETLVRDALENRHDLKSARRQAQAQEIRVKVARADRYPQVNLDARLNGADGLNIGYDDQYWSVSANLSVPLLDFGRRKHAVRRALHQASAARQRVAEVEFRVRREVRSAVANVRLTEKTVDNNRAALALAAEVSRIEQLKYDNGRGNIDDLLRARAQYKLSEAELVKARYDLLVALKNLKKTIEGEI